MANIIEVLSKFERGQELYQTSPLFNTCVNLLARGKDVHHLLELVINMHDEQIKRTQEIIEKSSMPLMFAYEKDTEINDKG